jgi:general secretion pathway protein G
MRNLKLKASVSHSRRAGFTLMEILIVLAILAVIIGLVLPNLLGSQKKANINAAKVQVNAVEKALELYAVDHEGDFPGSLDALLTLQGTDPKWKGPYLEKGKVPADPWGNPIQYTFPGTHQATSDRPDVWSMGPDKTSNTADDIANWGP